MTPESLAYNSELTRQGQHIATVKHAHHKVELDTTGKDSWRYKQAGAALSMLVTTSALQLIADADEQRDPLQLAERFLGEADLVLAEGFSQTPGPKIEVLRRATGKPPRCGLEDGLVAIVTDCPEIYPELPHFSPEFAAKASSSICPASLRRLVIACRRRFRRCRIAST